MANVPSQRFNYQQRVGRAGRQRQPFAFGVTLCRDRSHDDFYYRHPLRITGDPPPQPYLDVSRLQIVRRVSAAEALRNAFLTVPDELRKSRSTHGQMGKTSAWAEELRPLVAPWLADDPAAAEHLDGLAVYCGLTADQLAELRDDIRQHLVHRIDHAVASPHFNQPELSELLANAGVLPMFGFPTRERPLWGRRPRSLGDETAIVASRALDMAVSSFAPGAEVTKDKQTHLAVGFAAFRPWRGEMVPVDPLGEGIDLWRCAACGALDRDPGIDDHPACRVCGEPLPEPMRMYEPAGFRSDFHPRDFDDSNELRPGASRPQLSLTTPAPGVPVRSVSIRSLEGCAIYTVNDNEGMGYPMHRHDGGYVVTSPELYDNRPELPTIDREPDKHGAIGAVKVTDALLVDLDNIGAGAWVPEVDERRPHVLAALYSFAEMLRTAAADQLSVDPREMDVGLQPVALEPGVESRRIFLADRLENGAGYARHLGDPDAFAALLDHAVDVVGASFAGTHAESCDAACPDCLASYDNRYLHPQLDWRLGLDLAELAADRPLDESRWLDQGESIACAVASAFQFEPVELNTLWGLHETSTGRTVVLGHPAWSFNARNRHPRELAAAATANGPVHHADLFTALRLPQRLVPALVDA